MRHVLLFLILGIFLTSCDFFKRNKYSAGTFPTSPVNFEEINTEFDDYNSALNTVGENFPLCFSSTRNSNGENFDIVYKQITINFSLEDGSLDIMEMPTSGYGANNDLNLLNAVRVINTDNDELGPSLVPVIERMEGADIPSGTNTYILLYSNDKLGNQDVKFTHNLLDGYYESPVSVSFLNSEFDDAYPTFNNDFSEIYFTSNRDVNFDIYSIKTDNTKEVIDILTDGSQEPVEKSAILSSTANDKCPYIIGNLMVFASDRDGGFGGYDLYYSVYSSGSWSTPQNFGSDINTEYDEYRPVVRLEDSFTNDFMIFSSNRPGGLGGFDLYYVGIDKLVE